MWTYQNFILLLQASLDRLGRTASLPNLTRTPHALSSVTSLVSECQTTDRVAANVDRLPHYEQPEMLLPASVTLSTKSSPGRWRMLCSLSRNWSISTVLVLSEQSNSDMSQTKIRTHRSANFLDTIENDADGTSSHQSGVRMRAKSWSSSLHHASSKSKRIPASRLSSTVENSISAEVPMENRVKSTSSKSNDPNVDRERDSSQTSNISSPSPLRATGSGHQFVDALNDRVPHQPAYWTNATFFKPEILPSIPSAIVDDADASVMTRTKTVSTNLTITDEDNDEVQSKLIHEQLKRSSLGLARDSLELLRHALSMHDDSEERLIPHRTTGSAPRKRKSVLKSRLDSSDNLPTLELVSYIAIDDMQGDKYLVEKRLRYV